MASIRTLLVLMIFLATAGFAGERGVPQSLEVSPLAIETDAGRHWFEVEMAKTPEQQSQGLMFRREMADNHGMLFHYSFPQSVGFWMKDTYIPLDLIFIQPDGTIANIARETRPMSLDTIPSRGWVTGVLEINGGLAEALGIEAGDIVHHEIFGNAINAIEDNND